jgi:hypothetical protein
VTRFFVTSKGPGKDGDLGGLVSADANCQALAVAQGAGDHTWRAYLSTEATATSPAVNARDRIGAGPWYDSGGDLIAAHLAALHGSASKLAKDTAVNEIADEVSPEAHEILTGSRPDGTAFPGNAQRTCSNWTSSGAGSAQVGYSDRKGPGDNPNSRNSAYPTSGCSEEAFRKSGGAGLFYCFAIDQMKLQRTSKLRGRWRSEGRPVGFLMRRRRYGSSDAIKAEIATMSSLVSFSTTPLINTAQEPARSPVAIR